MKLQIKKIEKKLNKRVAKNVYSIGFDVAEAFTGVCILQTTDKEIIIKDLQLIETSHKEDHFNRADHYVAALEKFKHELNKYKAYKILVIERCFFGRNVETLIHLAHFGIITYIMIKKYFDTYYYFGATTARSIIGFNQKRQEAKGNLKPHIITRGKNKGKAKKIDCKSLVHDYLQSDFNITIEQKDQADAFVLALAGLLK